MHNNNKKAQTILDFFYIYWYSLHPETCKKRRVLLPKYEGRAGRKLAYHTG